jgi:hypothetical protein
VSVIGMTASATFDLPTGATVVCAFGMTLIALWAIYLGARRSRTVAGFLLEERRS